MLADKDVNPRVILTTSDKKEKKPNQKNLL